MIREYDPREVPNEWFCLQVEAPEHLVTATATNQLDDVTFDYREEEGHGTSGADGAGRHVLGL